MHPIVVIGAIAVLLIMIVVVKEFVLPTLFGTGLFGNPIAQAKAEAIVIKAQTDAEISQWYANQRIAEANAALHNQTVATDLMTTTFSSLLFIAGCATILIIVALIFSALKSKTVQRRSYGGSSVTYVSHDTVVVDGQMYRLTSPNYYERIEQNDDNVYAYLEGDWK